MMQLVLLCIFGIRGLVSLVWSELFVNKGCVEEIQWKLFARFTAEFNGVITVKACCTEILPRFHTLKQSVSAEVT